MSELLAPVAGLAPFEARASELRSWSEGGDADPVMLLAGWPGRASPGSGSSWSRAAAGAVAVRAVSAGVRGPHPSRAAGGRGRSAVPGGGRRRRHRAGRRRRPSPTRAHRPSRQTRVRVLLVVRDAAAFTAVLDQQLPPGVDRGGKALTVSVVGGVGDRRRFFANSVRGFLRLDRTAVLPRWALPERARSATMWRRSCGPTPARRTTRPTNEPWRSRCSSPAPRRTCSRSDSQRWRHT